MKVKMILPALTEAKSPFWRPIKYSLFPPLGLATLARVADLPADHPTDVIDQDHAILLIDHPEMACAYSRDGQQERDTALLETAEREERKSKVD